MKRNFNLFGLLFFISSILLSCETIEEVPKVAESRQAINDLSVVAPVDSGTYHFRYKENDYFCRYKIIDDKISYLDQNVEDLTNLLKENPSIAAYVHEDGVVEYYDSEDDLNNKMQKHSINSKQIEQRLLTTRSEVSLFEHPKCTGRSIAFVVDKYSLVRRVSALENGWDNIITSFSLSSQFNSEEVALLGPPSFRVTFYQNINFGGYSISFPSTYEEPYGYIHYLDRFPLYPGSSTSWDDQISSLEFKLIS